MEYQTKFNLGDTVYLTNSPDHGALDIVKIRIENEPGNCKIQYYARRRYNGYPYLCNEEDLTTENTKPKTIYDLACEDEYFYISPRGRINSKIYYGSEIDKDHINQGNAFLTKEEATKEVKRRKIHQELKRLAGGYEFEPNRDNFYISYDYYLNEIESSWTHIIKEGGLVYFETSEDVKNAMKEIGRDKLKKEYFGVDEE